MGLVATADVLLLDETQIIAWQWARGSSRVINVVDIAYDWNTAAAKGTYGTRARYTQGSLTSVGSSIAKYGQRAPLVISSRGLSSSLGGDAIADARAREVTRRFSEPPMVLELHLLYRMHLLEPGDQVRVTHARIPNPLTGARGLDREYFEVVNTRPFFGAEGKLICTLLWVGAIADPGAPTGSGAISTPPPAPPPIGFEDTTLEFGPETAGFALWHTATFTSSTPRNSYREAIPLGIYSYTVVTGDRLEYDVGFTAGSVDTRGGLDLACVERTSTTQAGSAAGTIVLDAGASAVDDAYNNMWVACTPGASPTEYKLITDYVGATKTATISGTWTNTPGTGHTYTIRRMLRSEAGVVDTENGLGASPATQLGSRALDQWYHRTIALPAAWVGKVIDAAGTGLDNDDVGLVTMRVVNFKITDSAGVVVSRSQTRASTDQGVWVFGTEQNVTGASAQMDTGDAVVGTANLVRLAVTRGGMALAAGPYVHNSTTETVMASILALGRVARTDDTVRLWVRADLALSSAGTAACTLVARIRRDDISGAVLMSGTVSRPASKGGTAGVFYTWIDMAVEVPPAIGDTDYVLTMQRTTGDASCSVDNLKLMALVRSA